MMNQRVTGAANGQSAQRYRPDRPRHDLKNRNEEIDDFTRELLIDATEVVASFLIRGFEALQPTVSASQLLDLQPEYIRNSDFNTFWDDTFGKFEMGNYSYPASEILYHVDPQACATEYNDYKSGVAT